jgi:hypothetical protein
VAGSVVLNNTGGTVTGQPAFIHISPDATAISNSETIKISGFTFDGGGGGYYLILTNGAAYNATRPYRSIIITGNTFQNMGSAGGNGNTALFFSGQVRGVIYSNAFDRLDFPWRLAGNDDPREFTNSAFNDPSFGSADNLYFENNTIRYSSSFNSSEQGAGWIESGQGGRWVVRFNTWNMANATGQAEFWDIHGDQNFLGGNGQTSTMISEFYDNTITNAAASVYRWIDYRGGMGMIFDNSLSVSSSPDIEVNQYAIPPDSRSGCYPYILNPDKSRYTGPDFTVNNTYFFNNMINGKLSGATFDPTINSCSVVQNGALSPYGTGVLYGWWNQNNSYNGTTQVGVGRGPIASRPQSCHLGDGWWATDQGIWNQSGSGGQGVLYKCTTTNTWSLYYAPYTYPHPLRGGSLAPTSLAAVAR